MSEQSQTARSDAAQPRRRSADAAAGPERSAALLHHRRREQHPAFRIADPARHRHRYDGIRRRRGVPRRALAPPAGPYLPQHQSGRQRRDPVDRGIGQARLHRRRAAHEQPRLRGAGEPQAHRRAAQAAHAAGAQEAVRDLGDPEDRRRAEARLLPDDRGARRPGRSAREQLGRVLVPAQGRHAPQAARRRRSFRPRASPAARHHDARQLHARRRRSQPGDAGRKRRWWRPQGRREFFQVRRQSADRDQHFDRRAGQAAGRRHRAGASPGGRRLAGTDPRPHRGADRQGNLAGLRD